LKTKDLVIVFVVVGAVILVSSSTAYGNMFSVGMFPNMGFMSNSQSSNSYAGMMGGMGNMMAGMGGMMNGYQMSGDSEQGFEMPCLADIDNIDGQMVFGDYQVIIGNYDFHPQNLTVKAGTTVTWINMDLVGHNVEAGTHDNQEHLDELFESPMLEHMQSFSYSFNEPGEYVYHCDPHPYMEGRIIVIE
jgi:amicyanin